MIVVTTPTGNIGRPLVDTLLAKGEEVRVIVRDPARLEPRVRERVAAVRGSHDDAAVVSEAFEGADQVFWLVPPNPAAADQEAYYLDFTRPACAALAERGVRRVVAVSSLGRDFAGPTGLLAPAFAMDGLFEGTGVHYRSLRMPYFLENLLSQAAVIREQGRFFLSNDADRPLATCAVADIAATAADVLLDPSWSGQGGIPVVGPDDLSPNGMARVMSEVLGRPVAFQQVSHADVRAVLVRHGGTESWAEAVAGISDAQNAGVYDAEVRTAPRTATGFAEWCATVLAPAVGS